MMQATSSAASGLDAQQQRLDVIAANIANVNTVGYKSARADFKDALYSHMKDPVGDAEANNLRQGSGVIVNATNRDYSDGARQDTGAQLDFSITGSGFFTLQNSNGERVYTRNGNFSISVEGGKNYLTSSDGAYVLSDQGTKIELPSTGAVSVDPSGTLTAGGQNVGKLAVMTFDNPQGLSAVGDSTYAETAASGTAYAAPDAQVYQGSLEASNVDLGQELTLMMRTQRLFSLTSTALRTSDEMDGLANSLK